jgi:hypothetical protein
MKPVFFASPSKLRAWLQQTSWSKKRALDNATSYAIHVTPRKHHSKWSAINVNRVHPLKKLGLLQSAGLLAFEIRTAENTYSYEQRNAVELATRDSLEETKQPGNFSVPNAVLSTDRYLVGDQREKGRNQAKASRNAYRRLAAPAINRPAKTAHKVEIIILA